MKETSGPVSGREHWLTVCGHNDADLAAVLREAVAARVSARAFSYSDVDYVAKLDRRLVTGSLAVSDTVLVKLQRLCQLWEVELHMGEIRSHRRVIGPLIVAIKKLLFPVMRILLKDTLRQQRNFNASVVTLLTELAEDRQAERGIKILPRL